MERKVLVVMPSQTPQLKAQALATLKANTVLPFDVFEPENNENKGWMGGCNLGLRKYKDYDYIVLANDDILVPSVTDWLGKMLEVMEEKPEVGILSVTTINAMGWARLTVDNATVRKPYEVPYCSFFFAMIRSSAIEKVGFLDEDLPGGDDLDYSYRMRKAGYKIGITPFVFIWHHYAQTGKRLFGEYWDSKEHSEKIKFALIKKHGFSEYIYKDLCQ